MVSSSRCSAWQGNMKPSCVQTNNNKLQTIKCKLTSLVCAGRSFNFIDCYCLGAIWSLYHRTESRGVSPSQHSSAAQPALVTTYLKHLSASGQHPKSQPWIRLSEKQIVNNRYLFEDTERKVLAVQVSGPWAKFLATMMFRTTRIVTMWLSCDVDTSPTHTRHSAVSFSVLWGRVLTSGIPVADIFIWQELVGILSPSPHPQMRINNFSFYAKLSIFDQK